MVSKQRLDDGTWNYGNDAPRLNQLCETPWRYQCPSCDSHVIAVREKVGNEKQHCEIRDTVPQSLSGVGTSVRIHDFRCVECSATFDDPYDKKEGCRRTIRDEHSRIGGLGQANE